MATNDRNLDRPEVYVPLDDGLWTCPECRATNVGGRRLCGGCGQLARHERTPGRFYSALFFLAATVAYLALCVQAPAATGWLQASPRAGALAYAIALVPLSIGTFLLLRRPTGRGYQRELREQRF